MTKRHTMCILCTIYFVMQHLLGALYTNKYALMFYLIYTVNNNVNYNHFQTSRGKIRCQSLLQKCLIYFIK